MPSVKSSAVESLMFKMDTHTNAHMCSTSQYDGILKTEDGNERVSKLIFKLKYSENVWISFQIFMTFNCLASTYYFLPKSCHCATVAVAVAATATTTATATVAPLLFYFAPIER